MRRKFIYSLGALITMLLSLISAPFTSVYADSGEEEITTNYIEITDYKRSKLNVSRDSFGSKTSIEGNIIYYFNMPFELTAEQTVSEVEINYITCTSWLLGIKGWKCSKKKENFGIVLNYENDLVYWKNWGFHSLFDYEENIIKEVGLTSTLREISDSLGELANLNGSSHYLAHNVISYAGLTTSTYDVLTNYKYYFAFAADYSWNDIVIRVNVINTTTGEEEEFLCGPNGEGCYMGGDPVPDDTPKFIKDFEDFFKNVFDVDLSSFLGILTIIATLFAVLILLRLFGFIGSVFKGFFNIFKFLFDIFIKLVKFVPVFFKGLFAVIKWIFIHLWKLLGLIIKVIVKLYNRVTMLFSARRKGPSFR